MLTRRCCWTRNSIILMRSSSGRSTSSLVKMPTIPYCFCTNSLVGMSDSVLIQSGTWIPATPQGRQCSRLSPYWLSKTAFTSEKKRALALRNNSRCIHQAPTDDSAPAGLRPSLTKKGLRSFAQEGSRIPPSPPFAAFQRQRFPGTLKKRGNTQFRAGLKRLAQCFSASLHSSTRWRWPSNASSFEVYRRCSPLRGPPNTIVSQSTGS